MNEQVESDPDWLLPVHTDPMVPPGTIEVHDEDGIVYRTPVIVPVSSSPGGTGGQA